MSWNVVACIYINIKLLVVGVIVANKYVTCEKLCFSLDTFLFVDERACWRLSAIQDCCFILHDRVVFLCITTLGNTIHH